MMMRNRHLEVLVYLLKHKKSTYKQLAQHFEVSTKTMERDINRLSAMGVPVYCMQGVGGGVRLDENYKFSTSFFTEADIHQIIFALKIMHSLSPSAVKSTAIDKLCLIAPELSAMFEHDAERYLSIDLLSEKVDLENWVYEKIDSCLDDERFAILNGTLKIAPIGYVLKPDGLYLFCFSNAYQLIKCKEIQSLEPTDTHFEENFISYEEYKAVFANIDSFPDSGL
ncbi:MAG: HTH domain-containing protein [Ruthenibacterium sp.]